MPYTTRQHMESRIAAAYGYNVQGVPLSEFTIGDGIIVLTKKGEPINSGQIEDMTYMTDEDGEEIANSVQVNGSWYYDSSNLFRVL